SFGEALRRQPESLPVIDQHLNRGCAPAAEHEQVTRKWIGIQLLPTQLGQRVNALAEIDRLHRHQNPHLRRDLNHPSVSRQTRSRLAQSGGVDAFHWMRIFAPREDSNSMTHSSSAAGGGVISSTNAARVAFRRWLEGSPSLFFSPI